MFFEITILLLVCVFLLPAFYLAGSGSRFLLPDNSDVFHGIYYCAFGMGMLVLVMFAAGTAGFFRVEVILSFTVLTFLTGWRRLPDFREWIAELRTALLGDSARGDSRVLSAGMLGILIFSFALCLLPEIANDALCYQLHLPKTFIWRQSTLPEPYDLNSYTPLFMNYLYGTGLLFGSTALAKFFHWWTGLLLLAGLMHLIRQKTGMRNLALVMGGLFFLTPTIFREVSTTYVDVAAALYIFLFVILLERSLESQSTRGILASGMLLGFAVSVKVLLLIAGVPVFLLLVRQWFLRRKFGWTLQVLLFLSVGFFLAAGGWFVRNVFLTGNPVYPYLGNLFGGYDYDYVSHFREVAPAKSFWAYLVLPWNMTFRPDDYDRGYWIGPAYLILLPFAMVGFSQKGVLKSCGLFVLGFVTIWYMFFHNVRFLISIFPFYFLAASAGVSIFWSSWVRSRPAILVLRGACVLTVLFLLLFALNHSRYGFLYLIGYWDKDRYLTSMERSYPVAIWMEKNLPPGAKILNAEEIRQFYFPRETVRNQWFQILTGYEKMKTPHDLAELLIAKDFTHILTLQPLGNQQQIYLSRFPLLRRLIDEHQHVKLIYEGDSQNIRELRFRYQIYEIVPFQTENV